MLCDIDCMSSFQCMELYVNELTLKAVFYFMFPLHNGGLSVKGNTLTCYSTFVCI